MKLLVIGGQWPPETFIARRLQGLAKAGVEVTVATSTSEARPPVLDGVEFLRIPSWDVPAPRRAWDFTWLMAKGAARSAGAAYRFSLACIQQPGGVIHKARLVHRLVPFAGFRPDVVHFEWNFTAVSYLPLFELMDCPMVVSCRGTQLHVGPYTPSRAALVSQLSETFERAAAVHCVSEAIKAEAAKYGLSAEKAVVIRPAVDPQFFEPAPKPANSGQALRIVTTGSAVWYKGYEYALIALRTLLDRGCAATLEVIIGSSAKAERERLLYTIHDLGLTNQVALHNRLKPAEVRATLQGADVFLLSSVSEGISNAVLEAMACGLPVVTTNCGGMVEAVTDGIDGLVVAVRAPDAVADALEKLASDSGLRARMGRSAREKIIGQFSLEKQIQEWVALYSALSTGSGYSRKQARQSPPKTATAYSSSRW